MSEPAPVPADQEEALREELRHAHARYLSARDVEATTYSCVRAAVEPIVEEIATLRAERDQLRSDLAAAVIQISHLARAKGEAEGRLRASEMVGVVEGWRDRATAAEARQAEDRAWYEMTVSVVEEQRDNYRDDVLRLHREKMDRLDRALVAEANLIALAKMYGEACSELQVLRALAQDVADDADDAEYDGFLLTPDPHEAAGSASGKEETDA